MTVRLLSYNIRHGGAGRTSEIAAVIRRVSPDVAILQEAVRPDVVREIAGATGLTNWGATAGWSVGFLSRVPVTHQAWVRPPWSRRAFLQLALRDTPLRIFGVHLSAVHSNWTEWRRLVEVRGLIASMAREEGGLHVSIGDFNTLAPGEPLDVARLPPRLRAVIWLTGGAVRFRTIQTLVAAGYVDGYRALHADRIGYTFPSWDPHVRLDYVFLPGRHAARLRSCTVIDGPDTRPASDHLPLLAEIDDE